MKSVPRCTCLMLCLFLSGGKKRGERKHYCTRESSKALFKLVATINREAASPFINMCYTSSRSRPEPLWSDRGAPQRIWQTSQPKYPHILWRATGPIPRGKSPWNEKRRKKSENYRAQTHCDLWINQDKCARQRCCTVLCFTPDSGVCQCWWWKITPQRQSYSLILKPCLVWCSLWCSLRLLPGGSITPH